MKENFGAFESLYKEFNMAYLHKREKSKYILKKWVPKNASPKVHVLNQTQSLPAIVMIHQAVKRAMEMAEVVSWQHHLGFLLAELYSKLSFQVDKNILFYILIFQKAIQKRTRAKCYRNLRVRSKDYCEIYQSIHNMICISHATEKIKKLGSVKGSVLCLVVKTSTFFWERGYHQNSNHLGKLYANIWNPFLTETVGKVYDKKILMQKPVH